MAKKTKELKEELIKQQEKLKEIEKLQKLAEEEEKAQYNAVVEKVDRIAENNNCFIGVVLTPEDIAQVVKLAFVTKENVKIKYQIYFNE